jgi:hypothetical protein
VEVVALLFSRETFTSKRPSHQTGVPWSILIVVLLSVSTNADSLNTASDSLSSFRRDSESLFWTDSLAAVPDSLAGNMSVTSAWLFPLAVIAATGFGFYLLFSTRSK